MSLLVAKTLAGVGCINGLCSWMMPTTMLRKVYKAPTTPDNVHNFKYMTSTIMSWGLPAVYAAFYGAVVQDDGEGQVVLRPEHVGMALALAQIPFILQALRSLFVDENHKKLGVPLSYDITPLIVSPVFMYLGLAGQYQQESSLVFGSIMAFSGLSLLVFTNGFHKAWGDQRQFDNEILTSSQRALAFANLALATFFIALYNNVDIVTTMGLSWIPFSFMSLIPIVTKDVDKFGLNIKVLSGWVVFNGLVLASCFM